MAATALDFLSSTSALDPDTYRLGTTKVWSMESMQACRYNIFIRTCTMYVVSLDFPCLHSAINGTYQLTYHYT